MILRPPASPDLVSNDSLSEDALVGRERELELIRRFLDRAPAGENALVVVGEPGVGKTALLKAAHAMAIAGGARVSSAGGVESEAEVTFSGLHQAMLPLQSGFGALAESYRDALNVALGFGEGAVPDRLLVANATLSALLQAAEAQSLLLIIDDLPWLDRTSAVVLSIVARRLSGSQVSLLAASRTGEDSFFERARLPELELGPLDDNAALALMSNRFPTLAPAVRDRLLAEAEGNPLAVLELPAALTGPQRAALDALPPVLPLTRRLQALFRSRIGALPTSVRRLLLLIALDTTGDVRLLQPAADYGPGLDDFAAAEEAGLVFVEPTTHRLTFRHPMIRSAVIELSTVVERRAAHRALAEMWTDQPDRRVWHLAEAAVHQDDHVAGLLEEAAQRVLRRGDGVGAVNALIRAANLSSDPSERAHRLAVAAYIGAHVAGDLRSASRLLDDARRAAPDLRESLSTAIAASYLLLNGDGDIDAAHRLLVAALDHQDPASESISGSYFEALHNLLEVCLYGGRPELWEPFDAAVASLESPLPDVLDLWSKTMADPVRLGHAALDQLAAAINDLRVETDPTRIERIATATVFVDRISECREGLWRVVGYSRGGGAIAAAINALMLLGLDAFQAGRWDEVQDLTDEGLALCDHHGYRLLTWPLLYSKALLSAARGDDQATRNLADQIDNWAAPRRVRAVQWYASHARALAALGRGDAEYAFEQATSITPPGSIENHFGQTLWITLDLMEAAVRTGRLADAAAHVAAMEAAGVTGLSPHQQFLTAASAAIAAAETCADLFEQALTISGADRWPFELARVHLICGERLRRDAAMTQSRSHLSSALETFQRLGAQPWVDRAAKELRATGQIRPRREPGARAELTPQELEIATLAASGLTNKEIGAQLFLSHRTVGAHLYRIFPKLSITSRAALRDALEAQTLPELDDASRR